MLRTRERRGSNAPSSISSVTLALVASASPAAFGPPAPSRSAAVAAGAAQEDGDGASEKPPLPPATGGLEATPSHKLASSKR